MKNLKPKFNKALSVLLSIIITLSVFSGLGISAAAATTPNPYFSKIADAPTLDGWKSFFGSTHHSTENAGGVWTDKSVFADTSAFTGLTDAYNNPITPSVTDRSFLVALSAIASNKSIVGYSHIPTDTVLVLDVSGSMGPVSFGQNPNNYNDAVAELVLAANAAVDTLLKLNNNNRVGVVLYSASGSQFLAVDRYTATNTITYDNGTANDTTDDRTIGEYFVTNNSGNRISVASGVKDSDGDPVSKYSNVTGATYIQDGIMEAAGVFRGIAAANDTVIKGDGFQSGTQRKPVVVLMSDGAPTYASTDYKALSSRDLGSGSSTSQHYAFVTQLTAAYAKQQITNYYNGSEALFYTLGLGVGSNAVAESTLNPADSTPTIAGYWDDYLAASDGARLNLVNNVSITVDKAIDDINYSDGYYSADTKAGLFEAFDKIVNQIIIQSLYRPTLVEENDAHMDGYIEFRDDIGDFMHVHSIKGIMIGNKLYTGQKLAENFQEGGGALGTVNSPNDLGNHLIWAVQQRLGIDDVNVARQLVKLAYEDGQLRYTNANDYSNYIGWYADENGKFIGFWDKDDTYADVPVAAGKPAKYINKSYGMLGEIKSGLNISDLMYVSIQVHTEIADMSSYRLDESDTLLAGHTQLIFRVPAPLIPVVSYDITLEGTSYENARNIEMTITDADPIRLLFEVGLRHDINEFNIDEAFSGTANAKGADGKYRFYTNEYSVEQFNKEIDEDSSQYIHPTESINTLSYFEPNLENERYYYTEPTPIYVKTANGYVKYSSDTKPVYTAGTYFRKLNVFEHTAATNDGNAAVLVQDELSYEEISEVALGKAVKSDTNGGWNIPKDTIHRYYDKVDTQKANNETNTLDYSFFLTVEHDENSHYYSDAILGNNGLLTVTPATGLSITKTVDATLLGTTDYFSFKISNPAAANEAFTLTLRDPNANFETAANPLSFDANGDATVSLRADWTAYITGIPTGNYTVTEVIPTDANYEAIEKPTGAVTVTQNAITPTAFKNALKQSGYLVITKEVTHPFSDNAPTSLYDKDFTFEVSLSNANATYPDAEIDYFFASDTATVKKAAVNGNKITVKMGADDTAIVKIRENWTVDVIETDLPAGFTNTSVTSSAGKTITTNHNVEYDFINNYSPSPVTLSATLNASKQLTGKPWISDTFEFSISRFDASQAGFVPLHTAAVTAPAGSDTKEFGASFASVLNSQTFTSVGTYHYSISEIVPQETRGITYDAQSRDFHVEVTDNDTDGFLEAAIHAGGRTTVNGNVITADKFVNTYKSDGIAEVTLEVNKSVKVPAGTATYALDGFNFGLFDSASGTQLGNYVETDANGIARFILTFNADNVTPTTAQTYSYELREQKGAVAGMTYAAPQSVVITVTDNLDGTIKATTTYNTNADGTYIIPVENVYNPDDAKAQVVIDIEKTVNNTGTASITPEGFTFEISEEIQTANAEVLLGTVTTDANGKAQFTLGFTPEDVNHTRIFTVKEINEGKADITYSTKVYKIEVRVTLDSNNKLIATATSTDAVINGNTATAAFENTYSGNLPEVKLEATKTQAINDGTAAKGAAKVVAGDIVTYAITVKNTGEIAATDITVTDIVPNGLIIANDSITNNGVNTNGTITWTIASLAVGEEITVSFKATVPEAENGTTWKNIALTAYDKDHDDTPEAPDDSNEVIITYELPESPKTGDASALHLWLALAVISGSGAIFTAVLKKKNEQENN